MKATFQYDPQIVHVKRAQLSTSELKPIHFHIFPKS